MYFGLERINIVVEILFQEIRMADAATRNKVDISRPKELAVAPVIQLNRNQACSKDTNSHRNECGGENSQEWSRNAHTDITSLLP
mmetsp:Transcript_5332/g.11605  ORF Transcript_5332/g.11605 Transcript_5332/m.11605 type:complete len:85 (-) Transcript_5332:1123-1377(-)